MNSRDTMIILAWAQLHKFVSQEFEALDNTESMPACSLAAACCCCEAFQFFCCQFCWTFNFCSSLSTCFASSQSHKLILQMLRSILFVLILLFQMGLYVVKRGKYTNSDR
eukprot:g22939.t1